MNANVNRARLAQLKIDRDTVPAAFEPLATNEAPRRPKRLRRHWRAAAAVAVVLLLVAGGLLLRVPSVNTVALIAVIPSQQLVQLSATGHVVAQTRSAVASKGTGRLIELRVREGSHVRQGDLLARLDASDVDAALAASRAALLQAQAQRRLSGVEHAEALRALERNKDLQAQGFISPLVLEQSHSRVDAADAAIEAADATVEVARAQLAIQTVNRSYTDIRAPFDGVVLVKNANVGDIITPLSSAAGAQGAVVTMADLSTLEVEADVSESQLTKPTVGQPVEIVLDALPESRFLGKVTAIVPTVDRAKATVTVKIRFDHLDPRVLPEMGAKVGFLSRAASAAEQATILTVAPAAVVARDGRTLVFRITAANGEEHVAAVPVQLGRSIGDALELLAGQHGLKRGDRVVLDPSRRLQDGSAVRSVAH